MDLLRFVRNVISHANQHPETMMKFFGSETPSEDQIYDKISSLFPFFFLHSEMVLKRLESHDDDSESDVFFEEYEEHETDVCSTGLREGIISPLKESGVVYSNFAYFHPDNFYPVSIQKEHKIEKPRTKAVSNELVKEIVPVIKQIWPDMPLEKVIARNYCGENILTEQVCQYFEREERDREPMLKEGALILENSTIDVSPNQCLVKVSVICLLKIASFLLKAIPVKYLILCQF